MAQKTHSSLAICISLLLFYMCLVGVDSRSNPRKLLQLSSMERVPAQAQDSSSVFGSSSLSSAGSTGRKVIEEIDVDNIVSHRGGEARIQYEEGIVVETVLNGNRLNMSIFSTSAVPSQEYIYAIDSYASQLLRIWLPIDQGKGAEVARRVAGDSKGRTGCIDGWGEDALLDHPKGMAVDGDGNVYLADVWNRVIRKVTPAGYVTTIAGQQNRTGYGDGEGRNALFSADFDLTYAPRDCSLLVADRGNRVLRMIQLKTPVQCNSGRSVSSGNLWETVGILFMVISTVLSAALGRAELERRKLHRTVAGSLYLEGNRNGEASDEPNPGDREATRQLLANSAATHRNPPSDLMDFSEGPYQEIEHGRPITNRLANSAAYGSRDGENDSVLSISSAGEEGDAGTSASQTVEVRSLEHHPVPDSESTLIDPTDSFSGHHANSAVIPSLDQLRETYLHLFRQNSGN